MAEFEEKLNSLLSNPDAMAQIMQMAQSLSGRPNSRSSHLRRRLRCLPLLDPLRDPRRRQREATCSPPSPVLPAI